MMVEMGKRNHLDYSAQAALQGIKLAPLPGMQDGSLPEGEPETWIDDKKAEAVMANALMEKRRGRR